jgi:UDP-N-acetylmuramate: L-alanyl-gamma-D-glutamyl-meso-diaminopimelate ligase
VRNALAAIAVGAYLGLAPDTLADGLRTFRGIKRRLETVGVASGVTILDDFAHHPTAVHETLTALRSGYPGRRVWAVFEPRSASSCRRVFQEDFARAFGAADEVVVAAVFRSTLPDDQRLSSEQLVSDLQARGQRARYVPEIDSIVRTIVDEHREGDLVVLMSNGAFGGIHQKLLKALAA